MAFDILSFAIGKAAGGGGAEEVETSVALDFSGGDMEVTPNEGEAFSKVTIPKPETLVAGNIAEGVTVAGILGTHSGGSGSSGDFRYVTGSFDATESQQTVSHEIGEVPDVFVICCAGIPEQGCIFFGIGFSQAMIDKLGEECFNRITFLNDAGGSLSATSKQGIEYSQEGELYELFGGVRSFSSTTFTVGGSSGLLQTGISYSYYAICGLV